MLAPGRCQLGSLPRVPFRRAAGGRGQAGQEATVDCHKGLPAGGPTPPTPLIKRVPVSMVTGVWLPEASDLVVNSWEDVASHLQEAHGVCSEGPAATTPPCSFSHQLVASETPPHRPQPPPSPSRSP